MFGSRIYETESPKMGEKKLRAINCLVNLKASKMTVVKARKALGCKSIKIAGKNFWLRPTRPLERALEIAGHGRKSSLYKVKAENKYAKRTLRARLDIMHVMESHHYDILASDVRQAIFEYSTIKRHANGPLYTARKELGVITKTFENKRHWLLPHQEVLDWLEQELKKESRGNWVSRETIFKRAEKVQWSRILLLACYEKLAGTENVDLTGTGITDKEDAVGQMKYSLIQSRYHNKEWQWRWDPSDFDVVPSTQEPDESFFEDIEEESEGVSSFTKGLSSQESDISQWARKNTGILRDYLKQKGVVPAVQAYDDLKKKGYDDISVTAMKKALRIQAQKIDGQWTWQLPPDKPVSKQKQHRESLRVLVEQLHSRVAELEGQLHNKEENVILDKHSRRE